MCSAVLMCPSVPGNARQALCGSTAISDENLLIDELFCCLSRICFNAMQEMNEKMGSTLTYCHENGINFAHVLDDLIVGSCLQTPEDLNR